MFKKIMSKISCVSGKQFPAVLIPLIDLAKNKINIVVYDWHWYENNSGNLIQLFNQAIIRAAQRGIKISAVVNNGHALNFLKAHGVNVKRLNSGKTMHAKLMIIDDETVITGSHNYTLSAFERNFEFSVILTELENIAQFNSFFENLFIL
jgi:phosphatidylserine/phosphatidylglycerophosphate/cardiolipin synthase-like enzyme